MLGSDLCGLGGGCTRGGALLSWLPILRGLCAFSPMPNEFWPPVLPRPAHWPSCPPLLWWPGPCQALPPRPSTISLAIRQHRPPASHRAGGTRQQHRHVALLVYVCAARLHWAALTVSLTEARNWIPPGKQLARQLRYQWLPSGVAIFSRSFSLAREKMGLWSHFFLRRAMAGMALWGLCLMASCT